MKDYSWQTKNKTNMINLTNYLNNRIDLQSRSTPSLSIGPEDTNRSDEDIFWNQVKVWSPELIRDYGWNDAVSKMREAIADYFENLSDHK